MMARDIARHIDPVLLARDVGIEPDPWQAELLRTRPRRSLLLCSRQSGKSTATALQALWTAIYEAPALVVIVSPSQRQSAEMFRTLMLFHSKLQGAPALNGESVLKAELANGSRILALPGTEKTVRGLANVSLAIVDEASRVDDELLAAIRPMTDRTDDASGQARLVLRGVDRDRRLDPGSRGGDGLPAHLAGISR
jgi:Terminase large subunit, T4likevirus-type, N-terminal